MSGRFTAVLILALVAIPFSQPASASAGHDDPGHADAGHADAGHDRLHAAREMMQEHQRHAHAGTFEAMNTVSPEHMRRNMRAMMGLGLALPPMDSRRGRQLFLGKGCVACHAVNGIGGQMGPSFDATSMPQPMNLFEFAARMWRSAPAMVALQQAIFGEVISLNGQEMADIIAFVHDEEAQAQLSADQIPYEFRKLISN